MTKILNFKEHINNLELEKVANAINDGKLVIFPTETVYGIGADATNSIAVDNIFITKGRANDNPLIVHISSFEELNNLVYEPSLIEKKLMNAFMPGPLTIILKKKDIIPNNVSCNLDTIGIRMPDNEIAHNLIKLSKKPIAAPSANLSGKPSGTRIEDIYDEFNNKVEYIIDGGETLVGVESTVVKVIDNIPTILRPGKITPEDIINVVGTCKIDGNIFKKVTGKVESPGMKYKHYAPNTKCLLVFSKNKNILKELVNENITKKTVIIGFDELSNEFDCKKYLSFGTFENYDEISHNIFKLLRQVDEYNADKVLIMGVEKNGLGIAIMNRLIRSANYNYIEK